MLYLPKYYIYSKAQNDQNQVDYNYVTFICVISFFRKLFKSEKVKTKKG